jgi:hypothetical protein
MKPRGLTVIDRVGQRVGKLVVLERAANKVEKDAIRACWLCECDCGNKVIVSSHSLSKGLKGEGGTRSCGCLMKVKPIKHGLFDSRIYRIWAIMLQRCTNPKNSGYASYGGRGITVCEEWKDFKNFFADMGHAPEGRTLDRRDNSLGYSKENCGWATRKEQGNNRRSNTYITYNGQKKTLSQWASATGITTWCISGRLKSGWPIEKALTEPTKRYKTRATI